MAQNNRLEKDKVRTQKEKRSKANLYKLSNPHKHEDPEGDYWATQSPEENRDHRPRINRSNKERKK